MTEMAVVSSPPTDDSLDRASTSSTRSLDLPSLQPLSHDHPLLSSSSFDADAFLLSRVHIPLEELRGELRAYLGQLREELVQLINDDYEEFISLGTGLRGEGERLRRLVKPLKGLGEEVEVVREVLADHQQEIQGRLDGRAVLREERALLDLLARLFETLDRAETLLRHTEEEDGAKLVARVAGEYTQLVYLVNKARAERCAIVDTVTERIASIKAALSKDLSTLLVEAIHSGSSLRQCLRTYELIDGWDEAEDVVRGLIQDFCRSNITLTSLAPTSPLVPPTPHPLANPFDKTSRLHDDSDLSALFNRVLAYVETYQSLMAEAEELSDHFDFFARVIWPEVGGAISERLGSVIFAAGRPDELHKHYTTTHRFMALLESIAPSPRAITAMRLSPSYTSFERRWQLPVYFQLRWKEIVSAFESSLLSPSQAGEWSLAQSAAAWRAIQTCWDDQVYIPELASRFWRLSLQIMARYGSWLKATMEGYQLDNGEEDGALRMATSAVLDLDMMRARTGELDVVKASGADHLNIPTAPFAEMIINILTRRSLESLKLVRSVASQFRVAPKASITTPSYFVSSILSPLHSLFASRPAIARYGPTWSTMVFESVLTNYAGILASVRKTEDLLRRHRKTKKTGFSLFGVVGGGGGGGGGVEVKDEDEEERFRKQMRLDIDALRADAEGLGVDVGGMEGWRELVEVVERPAE